MRYRAKCFLRHFLFSSLVALCSLWLVFGVWYPAPLNTALGVTHIYIILLLVDLTLGPLLTLIVAQEFKKTLKMDLVVIVFLQLSALLYGIYVVAQGRPVWMVFSVDRFDLVQANELADSPYLKKAMPQYAELSFFGGGWVAAQLPNTIDARNHLMFEFAAKGVDLSQRPDLYVPYESVRSQVIEKLMPLARLNDFNDQNAVTKVLSAWPDADAYLPLNARIKPMTVLIRTKDARVIEVVDLLPWK